MADGGPWVEFVAPLEPLVWGRNTYTILPVPPRLEEAAAAAGTHRVEGVIEDEEVNLAINRAEVTTSPCPRTSTPPSRQRAGWRCSRPGVPRSDAGC